MFTILASGPSCPGSIPTVPIIKVVDVKSAARLEESGQWLENVVRTHLVLVSGKPVLQKSILMLRDDR